MKTQASGTKLRKHDGAQEGPSTLSQKVSDVPMSGGVRLTISPSLLVRGKAVNPERVASNEAKRLAERQASGPAGKGRSVSQRIRPQLVASGQKRSNRGRKPNVVVEKDGYSIYNREASHLVDEFFTRKTDAINFLEKDQKMPWSQIKHRGQLVPVRVKIIIDEKDLKALGVLKQCMDTLSEGEVGGNMEEFALETRRGRGMLFLSWFH